MDYLSSFLHAEKEPSFPHTTMPHYAEEAIIAKGERMVSEKLPNSEKENETYFYDLVHIHIQ